MEGVKYLNSLEMMFSKGLKKGEIMEDKIWAWQPDENNYLESLTCPVIIPAEWLRNIIDDARLEGMIEAYKLRKEFKYHN